MSDEENFVESISITRASHFSVVHTWRIENFEQYFSSVKCHLTSIHSSVFGHENDPGTKWTLQLFPKGDKEASTCTNLGLETISFFINLDKSSDIQELPAKYSVALLGDDRCTIKVTGDNTFKRGSGWGRSKFMKLEEVLRDRAIYLIDDALTVRCTVHYTKHTTSMKPSGKRRRGSNCSTLIEPAKILNTDNLSSPESPRRNTETFPWYDVTFVVSGSYIRAHKWILAASSPLLAQLVHENEPIIKIDGIDLESFSQMVRFIYTGDCDFVNGCYKLLAIASKYKIAHLLNKCEDYLISILDKKNCYKMYSIADMYSSCRVKNEAFKFIEALDLTCDDNKLCGALAII